MKNKTICFISPKFTGFIGGMETHAIEFVNFFSNKKGYKIKSVITKKKVEDGISGPYKKINSNLTHLIKPILSGNFEEDAQMILQQSSPLKDTYYLNSPTWLPALVILKKKYPKMKIIVRSGGNDIMAGWIGSEKNFENNLKKSRTNLVSLINRYVEKLIVNSKYSFKRTAAVGVKKKELLKVIGGVDCNKFKPCSNKKNKKFFEIVTVGRLVKFKGFEYALNAIKEVIKNSKIKIKYTIIGGGPEKDNIKRTIKKLGLSNNVKLIGPIDLSEVPNYLIKKDLFLHLPIHLKKKERGSSYIHTETMGRCLCEAAACGLPVITSKVGGVPEIVIDKETGFIVKEKDYIAAAKKIKYLINNSELREEMSKNARRRAENFFDFKKVFKIYEKFL